MENVYPLNLAGLALIGLALFLAIRIVYERSVGGTHDVMRTVLQIVAGVLFLLGLGATAAAFVGMAVLIVVPFALAFYIESIWSYFRLERQAVLEYLSMAVEKRIPLATAARAYAIERGDILGWRGVRLAEWLERGASLSAALRSSGHRYGIGPALAIGVGDELGCLPQTLRETTACEAAAQRSGRGWGETAFYLTFVSLVGAGLCSFYLIKIAPVIGKMLDEFAMSAPAITTTYPFLSLDSLGYAGILLPNLVFYCLIAGLFVANSNIWPRFLPFIRILDRVWVLRALAWGVEAGHSVPQTLHSISRYVPGGTYWERIMAANARIAAGVPWVQALHEARVISSLDATILAAAERAGNVPWACRQRATSYEQAHQRRLRLATTLSYPVFLLLIGYFVFVFALQIFAALAHLVGGLA